MLRIQELSINGDYLDMSTSPIAYGWSNPCDLNTGLRWLSTLDYERMSYRWEVLRLEDDNGRILARKHRWGPIEVWQDGRWCVWKADGDA